MIKNESLSSKHIVRIILWIALTALITLWIVTGGGLEAWVALVSTIVIPLVLWLQSRPLDNSKSDNLDRDIHLYLVHLQDRLQADHGIRNFVSLSIEQNPKHHQIKTITDAYAQLDHFAIVGQAGTGKTTLMRKLALQAVHNSLENTSFQWVPVWFNLSEWEDKETLETFVRRQWINVGKPLETISQQNGIVFLDGIDELGPNSQKKIKQLNSWLQSSVRLHKVVATCRIENFAALNLDLRTVTLAPELTDLQICKFAHTYLRENAKEFLALTMLDVPECYETPESLTGLDDNGFVLLNQESLNRLHKLLDAHFDLEELRTLCFNLGIVFDNLRSEGKASKARELILLLARNGRLPDLITKATQQHPHIAWTDTSQPSQTYDIQGTLQAMATQYTNGKEIEFLLEVITETRDRVTNKVPHFKNLFRPFTQTPFQITNLFQYFQVQLFDSSLPLNLGKATDFMARAIWNREKERRSQGWVFYEEVSALLGEYAYSIKSDFPAYSQCHSVSGTTMAKTVLKFDSEIKRVRYHQISKFQIGLGTAWKVIILLFQLPFIILGGLLNLINRSIYQLALHLRLYAIESVLYRFEEWKHKRQAGPNKATVKKIKPLIDTLISARILQNGDVIPKHEQDMQSCICFTDERFLEYFAAIALSKQNIEGMIYSVRYNDSWYRIDRQYDRTIISMCGLVKDHNTFLQYMAEKDVIVTAKCIASLDPKQVSDDLRERVVDRLIYTMLDIQNGGEIRSVECAELLYLFADVSIISDMLKAIKKLPSGDFRFAIAKTIARYGSEAVLTLLEKLKDPKQENIFPSVVRALGRIGDPRAREDLTKALQSIKPSDVWRYAPTLVALIRIGDQEAVKEFTGYIFEQIEQRNDLQLKYWLSAADLDVDMIPLFVTMLRDQDNNDVRITLIEMMVITLGTKASPILRALLKELAKEADNQQYTMAIIIDSLSSLSDRGALNIIRRFLDAWENEIVCLSAIKAVGQLTDQKAVEKLIVLTTHNKNMSKYAASIRAHAAQALGQIGNPQATRALKHLLCDHDTVFIGYEKEVCAFAADALRSIGTPKTWSLALPWYKDRLLNFPAKSREAQHAYLGLVNMGTPSAWEIINQWESGTLKGD